EATPNTIDKYMAEVQAANGLVGIAHPFDMGSPICTGCHWDYQVKDYNLVNYIEIWNSNQPQDKSESILAYDFWVDKLKKGYEISCSAGRDWHRPDTLDANKIGRATSELQSRFDLVCRLLLEKKKSLIVV